MTPGKEQTVHPPAPPSSVEGAEWKRAEGKKRKKKERKEQRGQPLLPPPQRKKGVSSARGNPPKKGAAAEATKTKASQPTTAPKKRKPPRTGAVTINCPPGEYEAVLREVKSKIDLASLNIEGLRVRPIITGALNYEVTGQDGGAKADALAIKLREALPGKEGVRIARPVKTAEFRLSGLDDSITQEEVIGSLAGTGGCSELEIKAGPVRQTPNGLASI